MISLERKFLFTNVTQEGIIDRTYSYVGLSTMFIVVALEKSPMGVNCIVL